MAPKKQRMEENQKDIRGFFTKPDDVAGCSSSRARKRPEVSEMDPTKVKKQRKEDAGTSELDDHKHKFRVKFGSDSRECMVYCKKQGTVLQTIKSERPKEYDEFIKKLGKKEISDENMIISSGEGNDSHIVATHFPCFCVKEGEYLTITTSARVVEKQTEEVSALLTGKCFVFFIDKEGGENTKSKTHLIFRCNRIPVQFRYFCVYGAKGMTVEEAVRRDGRFVDGLTNFTLSDNENKFTTKCTEIVDNLDGRKFQICLPKTGKTKATNPPQVVQEQDSTQQTSQEEENASASPKVQNIEVRKVLEYAAKNGVNLKMAIEKSENQVDQKEIIKILRDQFPRLREIMESRFTDRSYKTTLKNLKEEKFGKVQQSFSEAHRLEKLLKLGKSVCKVLVKRKDFIDDQGSDVCQGTGFVLFDRFVLTSAHLFDKCVQGKNLLDHIYISARFQYDDLDPETNYFYFYAEKTFIDIDNELDFAVLELKTEGQNFLQNKPDNVKVPAGLLDRFGPLPGNGEACLIGHPAGSVKKIDPTCIIEPEKREEAVNDHLAPHETTLVTIMSVIETIKSQGIGSIMVGGTKADKVETYNTFMYHGASGSPVFGADCRVFGIHTGGFTYGFQRHETSVIEYAHPLLTIFEKFVINLIESGNDQMLEKVKEAVTKNKNLKKILDDLFLQDEPMEED
ncbi:protein FAM111A-like [Poecilia formosa]|uniref:protein FAM111A-like n=1 Tax=Poecilia formosa TaxID=48698 RepID=UPI00044387CC|nr:PREDICTED: protein FAM111A-like [Poecilia formosa]